MTAAYAYTQSGLCVYDHSGDWTDSWTPPVFLIHGSMDRGTSFARLRNALRDIETVAYDRRGYHRSRLSDHEGVGFDRHVDDFLDVLGEREAVILGHSFGGDVALAAAQRRPDLVRAVVAYEPPLLWRDWWPSPGTRSWWNAGSPEEAAEAFIRRMIGDTRWERLPQRTRDERRGEGTALLAELSSLRSLSGTGGRPPFDPESLMVPVVIGRGSRTAEHQIRGTDALSREIPGAELVQIPGCAHAAHLTHPASLAALVRQAITRAQNQMPYKSRVTP